MGSMRVAETAHCHPPGDAANTSEVLIGHSVGLDDCKSKSLPVRKPFQRLELCGWPFVPRLWGRWGAK
jgi:hypothetical protein